MSPRPIPGDPLTGTLPRTQIIVSQTARAPKPRRESALRDSWPVIPDSLALTMDQLQPGRIASVRTRRGVYQVRVRVVNVSHERRNRGRHYIVGVTTRGVCHSIWADHIISVETLGRAIAMRNAIETRAVERRGSRASKR